MFIFLTHTIKRGVELAFVPVVRSRGFGTIKNKTEKNQKKIVELGETKARLPVFADLLFCCLTTVHLAEEKILGRAMRILWQRLEHDN